MENSIREAFIEKSLRTEGYQIKRTSIIRAQGIGGKKRPTPRYIIMKIQSSGDKDKILKPFIIRNTRSRKTINKEQWHQNSR